MDLPGGKAGLVPLGKARYRNPSFSPSGEELAYSPDNAIWVYNLKTKKARGLSHPASGDADSCPAWSPDGKRLVFEPNTSCR